MLTVGTILGAIVVLALLGTMAFISARMFGILRR
jgi:hypothetical protein